MLSLRASVCMVAVAAVAIVASVQARPMSDACGGQDWGTAGKFDFYVFAQSWPAQFCQAHTDWPGCSQPTSWQAHNLTLHGMWPNYNVPISGHDWPQCCQSVYGTDLDATIAKSLLPQWQVYWPNEQDPSGGDLSTSLWAHEWQKHGTCSGLDQRTYFQTAMNIELSMPTPLAIQENIGSSVALTDLQAAFRATGCVSGSPCWAGFSCSSQNGQLYLAGVTTCWGTNFTRIECPAAVLTGQGCTADKIYIQSF